MIVPFKAWHLDFIKAHERLNLWRFTDSYKRLLEQTAAYTVLSRGKIVACGGFTERHKNRAEIWGIVDINSREHFITAHKSAKKLMENSGYRRLEFLADCEWPESHRWAKAFGFKLEAERLRSYGLDGKDYSLYALVKGD